VHPSPLEIHHQTIVKLEQRHCDDLCDGFAHLKDIFPVSHEKCSQIDLLNQATNHVHYLQDMLQHTQKRLRVYEDEVMRLQQLSGMSKLAKANGLAA
ncbi:hypothetical protein FRC10_005464, partial [Ceratobasidium sp. 414]